MNSSSSGIPADMKLWHSVRKFGKWRFVASLSALMYVLFSIAIGAVLATAHGVRLGTGTPTDIALIALAALAVPVLSILGWFRQEELYRQYADRLREPNQSSTAQRP